MTIERKLHRRKRKDCETQDKVHGNRSFHLFFSWVLNVSDEVEILELFASGQ